MHASKIAVVAESENPDERGEETTGNKYNFLQSHLRVTFATNGNRFDGLRNLEKRCDDAFHCPASNVCVILE